MTIVDWHVNSVLNKISTFSFEDEKQLTHLGEKRAPSPQGAVDMYR